MKFCFQLNLILIIGDSREWWLFSDRQGSEQPHPTMPLFPSLVSSLLSLPSSPLPSPSHKDPLEDASGISLHRPLCGGVKQHLEFQPETLSRIHIRKTSVFPDQQLFCFSLYFCGGSYKFPSWPQTHYHGWSQMISSFSSTSQTLGSQACNNVPSWSKFCLLGSAILNEDLADPAGNPWLTRSLQLFAKPCTYWIVHSASQKHLKFLTCSIPVPLCSCLLRLMPKGSGLGFEAVFLACDPFSFQTALCIHTQFSGLVNFLLALLAGQSP